MCDVSLFVLLIVESVNLVVRVVIVRTTAELALGDLAKALLLPIPAAACMWPIVIAAEHATAQWPAALTLLIATMAGLLTYAAGLRLTAPDLYFAALDVVRSVLHRGESTAMSEKPPAMPSTAQCKVGRLPNSEGESL